MSESQTRLQETDQPLEGYQDLPPAKFDFYEWNKRFEHIPQAAITGYRYYRDVGHSGWSTYLFPPCTHNAYGARHLKRLHFDNALAAWRLWSFVLSESERLFRAERAGKTVVATLGDLGALPVLVSGFPQAVPFYPDCHWATPFLNESSVLFDTAQEYGLHENACFSRASLAAVLKGAYFPAPALFICASGATCDDFHAVMDLIEWSGRPVRWLGVPHCRDVPSSASVRCLSRQLEQIAETLSDTLEIPFHESSLKRAIARVNRLRHTVARLRLAVFSAPKAPLPASEAYLAEFALLHYYGDLDECQRVLDHLLATVAGRIAANQGVLKSDALRVVWVSPTPDLRLLDVWEALGGRVVGTEYLNQQSLIEIPEHLPPFEALAASLGQGSLFGATRRRAQRVLAQCRRYGAEGVIISSVLGASHCSAEASLMTWLAKQEGLPVLQFEVPFTGAELSGQVRTRLEAFAELLRGRR